MVANEARASVVCDAGPLIHLDEMGCLDLLADFEQVLAPDVVWDEVTRHRPDILQSTDLRIIQVPTPSAVRERLSVLAKALALDAGETSALALMQRYPTAIFLTDDAAARLVAEQLGMKVHGTIGIVLRAVRRGKRTPQEVVAILKRLPNTSTLHIRPSLLESIIDRVKVESGLN
jgi:predicted nucleic acid-binding protein